MGTTAEHDAGTDTVLSVTAISKKFARNLARSLRYGVADVLSEVAGVRREATKLRASEFWALRDITFELRRGETLALVGRNGSGKSTLLRLISGIIKPDTGRISYTGRIAPLIALGAGFNPVLTGRENVVTNLAILGLSRREIEERFAEVIDFSEIGEAIDAPLQTYSSGMTARLGFACAIHTKPDILLIDEALSVGDVRFRIKCYRKLHELRQSGISCVLVTHNTNAVLSMASRAMYLAGGRKVIEGEPSVVMSRYEEDLLEQGDLRAATTGSGKGTRGASSKDKSQDLWIDSVGFVDEAGQDLHPLVSGAEARMIIRYQATRDVRDVGLGVMVRELSDENDMVLNLNSERDGTLFALVRGEGVLELRFPTLGLRPGLYSAKVYLASPGHLLYDTIDSYRFRVSSTQNMSQCLFHQPRKWNLRDIEKSVGENSPGSKEAARQ